jgi:hypothetical protein
VPVAVNRHTIRKEKGPSGDFFQIIHKQRPGQYQGIYLVSPEGKVLAARDREPDKSKMTWADDVIEAIDDGLTTYGPVTPRDPVTLNLLPDRGVGRRPDGSIVLAVYTRYMSLGLDPRGFGEGIIDSIVLPNQDRTRKDFPGLEVGAAFEAEPAVARKFHRVLAPQSDLNLVPRADEVTRAVLTGKVVRIRGGVAEMTFSGRFAGYHVGEFDSNKGKKIRAEITLGGVGACEVKTGKLLSITLIGEGVYRSFPPNDEPTKYGAVVEWRLRR